MFEVTTIMQEPLSWHNNATSQASLHRSPLVINSLPDYCTVAATPQVVYWLASLFYFIVDKYNIFPQYKVPSSENGPRNLVKPRTCAINVLQQQLISFSAGLTFGYLIGVPTTDDEADLFWWTTQLQYYCGNVLGICSPHHSTLLARYTHNIAVPAFRFLLGLLVMDTHFYCVHRLMHGSQFFYRNFHSHHHRLLAPYAYSAIYGHPMETLLADVAGSVVTVTVAGLTPRMAILLLSLAYVKGVNDHSGYCFPWDPMQYFLSNDAAYHSLHHVKGGHKGNFAQPWFTFWDDVLGTRHRDNAEEQKKIL